MFNSKLLHWLVYCNDDRTGRDTRTQPFIVKNSPGPGLCPLSFDLLDLTLSRPGT